MTHDPFFAYAMQLREAAREAFDDHKHAAYLRAEEATNGRMLNARGERNGIDAFDLFEGNEATARAYASPELLEHWRSHTRPTFARFAEHYPLPQ